MAQAEPPFKAPCSDTIAAVSSSWIIFWNVSCTSPTSFISSFGGLLSVESRNVQLSVSTPASVERLGGLRKYCPSLVAFGQLFLKKNSDYTSNSVCPESPNRGRPARRIHLSPPWNCRCHDTCGASSPRDQTPNRSDLEARPSELQSQLRNIHRSL